MTRRRATIAGAGLAGLSAAVALTKAGFAVRLCDAAAQAGGRCRSYDDAQLGLTIDNGNHLVLSGNAAVARFRAAVGAPADTLAGPDEAAYDFLDLTDGARWRVAIGKGRLPWWVFDEAARVPGTRPRDYLALLRLMRGGDARLDERIATDGPLWDRFLHPVLLAVLNTDPASGSSALVARVLRETVLKGGTAIRPRIAQPTLAAAFADPALDWLRANGAEVRLGRRLRAVRQAAGRATALDWGAGEEALAPGECVILALPPQPTATLLPGTPTPSAFHAIVNGHFGMAPPAGAPTMLGLIGGTAEWLFAFPDRLSVTVSAADAIVERDRESLARAFWDDIGRALGIDAPMPPWQVVKEKRATFSATPGQNAKRPPARTSLSNVWIAGDWTDTGLPATIEGAIRSGETAAGLAAAAPLG